ncbi:MAG: UDP-N-acetylglucosamine--N-acetylmuramyl-(pentapeptide) pyrophosphoryl-undecaprenol N-acetylglucosamine transferase, partial [Bacteroides sp.]|nr:UDP-N-acetylglucosamine--N-acetylmuramyl-(pentapeptide) pyrophosphoryl-undecaprenol N-acetylglucosamine transferase [Bacteroides sp.]
SQRLARKIVKDFRPHAAVGVGGYASGPTLKVAGSMGIPTLLQEQNSYAGVTNKLLAKQAKKICVAYEGMERFFDKSKIILTGNPVRQGLLNHSIQREEAVATFGLDPQKKTVLILGGSLGARTINQCLMANLDKVKNSGIQFIWQTGKIYIEEARKAVAEAGELPMLHVTDFISDMATAYSAADLVISRAGAGSISEFCLLQKPVILVPSPNVAEDHQTKNALALVNKNAALYVKDAEAKDLLLDKAIEAVNQPELLKNLSKNIAELAFTDSANVIAKEVIKLAENYQKEHGR